MQLQGTESSMYIDLLRVFAYGTWTKYKSKNLFIYLFVYFYFLK